jgi:hypothetical protein
MHPPRDIKQALSLHMDCGLPSPMLADINYVEIMTNVVRKYKSIPKCKEMISDSMFHHLARLYERTSMDSFGHAVIHWIILGCYTSLNWSGAPITTRCS